jgi:hypothetical protein
MVSKFAVKNWMRLHRLTKDKNFVAIVSASTRGGDAELEAFYTQ